MGPKHIENATNKDYHHQDIHTMSMKGAPSPQSVHHPHPHPNIHIALVISVFIMFV